MLSTEAGDYKKYITDRFSALRKEQSIDDMFYRDKFNVPQIADPVTLQRTGTASRLIDSPAEHIITANPQAFRINAKGTKGEEQHSVKITEMINEKWVYALKHGNPDLFKEFVKKLLLRGDAYIRLFHNEKWVTGEQERAGLPVLFAVPDSMTIFSEPEDEVDGVPQHVMVIYSRSPTLVHLRYPSWSNPKNAGNGNRNVVEWIEYWTSDKREFYADEELVLETENVYGFVPFIHKLSGFGSLSPDGKLEDLIVGRLRYSRERLERECAIVSSIDWVIHNFANRSFDAMITQPNVDEGVFETLEENYKVGTGLMHKIPYGVEVKSAVSELPEPQIFAYLAAVKNEIDKEDPLVMAGIPIGESGRQQDMTQIAALRRYDTVVENTEYAFGQALGMALKICEIVPGLYPSEDIPKEAIDGNYQVTVKLKAADPLENDRKATLGSRMLAQGEIDPITNLVEFKGYTLEKAHQIMRDILKWKVLLFSPDVAELIGLRAAEQSGMAEQLQMLKMRRQQIEKRGALGEVPSPTMQNRMAGETKTPGGMEMIDMALSQKGARKPPAAYERS